MTGDTQCRTLFYIWTIFSTIVLILILSVLGFGLFSPSGLVSMLRPGAFIESFGVVFFLSSCLIWLSIAIRQNSKISYLYAAFNLFLAGEESSWGREAVLGFILLPGGQKFDLHNSFAKLVTHDLIPSVISEPVQMNVQAFIVYSLMLTAFVILTMILLYGLLSSLPTNHRLRITRRHTSNAKLFGISGLFLMSFGFIDIVTGYFGYDVFPATWPFEETFELLGALALLFSAIVAVWESSNRKQTQAI